MENLAGQISKTDGLFGNYRAKVVNNVDPNGEGRVELFIPILMSGMERESIWADPAFNWGGQTETGVEYGEFKVPVKGSYVWVFFEGGNPSFPYYFAGLTLKGTKKTEPSAEKNSENVFVIFKTPNGNTFYVSDNNDEIIMFTKGKRELRISDKSQNIILKTEGHSITMDDSKSEIVVISSSGQQVILDSEGKAFIYAPNGIDVDGGSSQMGGGINGLCKCHLTGHNHGDTSQNVKISK